MNGCRAPYDIPYDSFQKCTNKEDIQRSTFNYFMDGSKYYAKACRRISKIDVYSEISQRNDGYFVVTLVYPRDVKLITQSKEIDGHALIGNIGGYIGLFLGNQLLLNTKLVLIFL